MGASEEFKRLLEQNGADPHLVERARALVEGDPRLRDVIAALIERDVTRLLDLLVTEQLPDHPGALAYVIRVTCPTCGTKYARALAEFSTKGEHEHLCGSCGQDLRDALHATLSPDLPNVLDELVDIEVAAAIARSRGEPD